MTTILSDVGRAFHSRASVGCALAGLLDGQPSARGCTAVVRPPGNDAYTYMHHVHREAQVIGGEKGSRLLAFWKEYLAGVPSVLELPTSFSRPPRPTFRGDAVPFTIGEQVSEAVSLFAKREGVSSFVVLMAAYMTLLHRYTQQSSFAVGTPTAGRTVSRANSLGLSDN